jgi:hypothetical protein
MSEYELKLLKLRLKEALGLLASSKADYQYWVHRVRVLKATLAQQESNK